MLLRDMGTVLMMDCVAGSCTETRFALVLCVTLPLCMLFGLAGIVLLADCGIAGCVGAGGAGTKKEETASTVATDVITVNRLL